MFTFNIFQNIAFLLNVQAILSGLFWKHNVPNLLLLNRQEKHYLFEVECELLISGEICNESL